MPHVKFLYSLAVTLAFHGFQDKAKAIFDYIATIDGNAWRAAVGMALNHMSKGQFTQAIQLIEKQVDCCGEDKPQVLQLLALALKLDGQEARSQSVLGQLKKSQNPASMAEDAANLRAHKQEAAGS